MTHLAQVAAQADTHVVVAKQVADDVTTATATLLDANARTAELARMLSGDDTSAAAREHAADLLRRGSSGRRRGVR